jgi:hypothetical protein
MRSLMDKYAIMECKLRQIMIKLARLKLCAAILLTRQCYGKNINHEQE